MSTPADIIDSARYDLQDYQEGLVWDDVELLNYLNRIVGVLDYQLAAMESDLVLESDASIDTVEDQNYVDISSLNSGNWIDVHRVWIEQDLIEHTAVANIYYKRIFRDGSQRPYYWALKDQKIIFEADCDDAYDTLVIEYFKKNGTLSSESTMPYYGIFDDTIREMLVLHALGRKEGGISQINALMEQTFKRKAMEAVIQRNHYNKPYYIDF